MKTVILALAAMTIGASAKAETFDCHFTEPFMIATYDTGTRVLKVTDEVLRKTKTIKSVEFKVVDAAIFSLRNRAGAELLSMNLNYQGGDGMSENSYPYEGKLADRLSGTTNLIGGCWSSLLPFTPGE